MAELRGVNRLQTELERAKESLKGVDEHIKKLTGRDPTIQRPQRRVSLGSSEPRGGKSVGADRIFSLARRGIVQDEDVPRRRIGGAFSRLGPRPGGRARGGRDSGDEEDSRYRPAVQSSVVATPKEERSRQNSIEEQSKDRKGQARNRRMFGLLLGTLQKFKDESKESKEKEEQRIKIEKKLDEKFKQEKEEIIQERRQLFLARRQKQFHIRLMEQKMEMAQNHDNWAMETRKLDNFIRTKAKPHLFYMPKILTPESDKKLVDTKSAVDAMIEERRKKLEHEIEEMMRQVQDVPADVEEDGDASMGEDKGCDEQGGSEGEAEKEQRDDKENRERDKSGGGEEELVSERELRDKEREQRDRDRRMKDARREERAERKRERERSGDTSKEPIDNSKEREKDKDSPKPRDKSLSRSRDRHRSHSRDRHKSGRIKTEKSSRRHSDSDKHGSKSKRRSKGEGKSDKREKVWEPMEDEEEEEFMGNRDGEKDGNIQSKMLEMAGMGNLAKEMKLERESEARGHERTGYLECIGIEKTSDIPTPSDGALASGKELAGNDTLQQQAIDADPDAMAT